MRQCHYLSYAMIHHRMGRHIILMTRSYEHTRSTMILHIVDIIMTFIIVIPKILSQIFYLVLPSALLFSLFLSISFPASLYPSIFLFFFFLFLSISSLLCLIIVSIFVISISILLSKSDI